MKKLFLGLLASVALFISPASAVPNFYLPLDSVGKITCSDGRNISTGTAHIIGDNLILTAAHTVYRADWCVFAGMGTRLVYSDNERNLAALEAVTGKRIPLPISCKGVEETFYMTTGISDGYSVVQPLYGTSRTRDLLSDSDFPFTSRNLSIVRGDVFSGMAGGPVIDLSGRVVGVVVGGDVSSAYVRDLSASPLCTRQGREKLGLSTEPSPNRR